MPTTRSPSPGIPTPGATSYHLYGGTSSGGEGPRRSRRPPASTYIDTNLTGTPVYFYEVTAVNSAGESARSAEDDRRLRRRRDWREHAGSGLGQLAGLLRQGRAARRVRLVRSADRLVPQVLGSSGANSPGHVAVDMAYASVGTLTFNDVVVPTAGLHRSTGVRLRVGLPGVTDRQIGLKVNGTVITSTERFPITGASRLTGFVPPGAPERGEELHRDVRHR